MDGQSELITLDKRHIFALLVYTVIELIIDNIANQVITLNISIAIAHPTSICIPIPTVKGALWLTIYNLMVTIANNPIKTENSTEPM